MNRSSRIRLLLASAATAAAIALAGCVTEGTDLSGRAMTPLSGKMVAELEQKNMSKDSPILVRLYKQEAELEVWKKDRTGRFTLLKSYPICRWSGELGPKIKEGDRQAPEGFYSITPAQMNPKSRYYLAFNMGYPNAYDRAWGRTGAELMIHGDCSSRGCYAMTDEQISEIYALGREAFFGGQRAFQVQAYPFRMTPENFAKHRNNPNMAFWKMLKRGSDHFEVTRAEPKVDVCEKRYVFDANATSGSFSPSAKCPAYEVPSEITAAVNEKQKQDEFDTAEMISRGTKTSPIRMGTDGGMHPIFMAALQKEDSGPSDRPLRPFSIASRVPGTIPPNVVPPRAPEITAALAPAPTPATTTPAPPVQVSRPVPAPAAAPQQVAKPVPAPSAPPQIANVGPRPTPLAPPRVANTSANGSIYANTRAAAAPKETTSAIARSNLAPKPIAQPAAQLPRAATTAPTPLAVTPQRTNTAGAIRPKPVSDKPASDKAVAEKPATEQPAKPDTARASNSASLVTGAPTATPMAPAGSFESRWSAITGRGRF